MINSRTVFKANNPSQVICPNSRIPAISQLSSAQAGQQNILVNRVTLSKKTCMCCRNRRGDVQCSAAANPLKVMIFGAPACGKGTQCSKIVDKYGLVHISVGDLLRSEVSKGSPEGVRAKSFMDQGQLVPNDVVVDMVKARFAQPDVVTSGWLLDGYPRSAEQAEAIEKENIRPDIFIQIDVSEDSLVKRVTGRRSDPETGEIYHMEFKPPPSEIVDRLVQRSDDTEEKVKARLQVYNDNLDSVVGFYTDIKVALDGNRAIDEVFADIDKCLSDASAKQK